MLQVNYAAACRKKGYEPAYACGKSPFQEGFLHCHDVYELFFFFQGGGNYYCINNEVYPIQPNQLVLLPPFCVHGLLPDEERLHYDRGSLYVTADMFRRLGCGQIEFEQILQKHVKHGRYQFTLPEDTAEQCRRLLQRLVDRTDRETALDGAEDCADMLALLCMVVRQINDPRNDVHPVAYNRMMHDVVRHLHSHFTENLTLDQVAEQFHLSASYLSHAFARYTGRSVYEYILFCRITMAQELLHSDLPLTTIAYQCGFNDYSNFLRTFKRLVGLPPSVYRRQIREAE